MDRKQMVDEFLADVPEEQRKELVKKLVEAETMEERFEIVKSAGVDPSTSDAPAWLSESFEVSDEDLEKIAGGGEMHWYDYGGCSCY